MNLLLVIVASSYYCHRAIHAISLTATGKRSPLLKKRVTLLFRVNEKRTMYRWCRHRKYLSYISK